jgi:hypothetical protein
MQLVNRRSNDLSPGSKYFGSVIFGGTWRALRRSDSQEALMRFNRLISAFALAAVTAVGACSKKSSDAALQSDLSLASQQQQIHLDSISALEANNTAVARGAALRSAPTTTTRRTTTYSAPRQSTSSGTSSSGTTTTTSSSGDVVVKHTQRDAAIGAAAGAVIGATTSRNKVKGGLIGAAVGGLLGGVVGNNVDKTKKPPM